MAVLDLSRCFGSDSICIKTMEVPECRCPRHLPAVNQNYVFDPNALNQLLLYLAHPLGDCLYISGPSGCGKTTLVHQAAARLGWGVEQITLCNKSESVELIGHTALRHGELIFEYGPLVKAMLEGEILILNEIDLMSPGDLSALNDVLEGRPLTVTGNQGEIIMPHPFFRVIATANTRGMGDSSGFYNGARLLNQAFLDRWRFMEIDYPAADTEKKILCGNCRELDETKADQLIKLAGELRRVGCNTEKAGVPGLSAPFSTRVLLRIAAMVCLCPGLGLIRAVDMGFGARLPDIEREYVRRLCEDIFGHDPNGAAAPKRTRRRRSAALQVRAS